MGLYRRTMKFGLAVARAALAFTIIGAATARAETPANESPSVATWELVDVGQRVCLPRGMPFTYFWILIDGSWSAPVTVGAQELPPGVAASSVAIPPGSSDGHTALAGVYLSLPSSLPIGVYTPQLWASDGASTQTVPVTIEIKNNCY